MEVLAQLTTGVSFASLALSLWLGGYVVTRSLRSRLAWLAGLTLWALAGVFVDSLVSVNPAPVAEGWPGWPIHLPLAFWYHLSLKILPPPRARWQGRMVWAVYGAAASFDVLLGATAWMLDEARGGLGVYLKPFTPGPLFFILPVGLIGLLLAAFYNFWQARQLAVSHSLRQQFNVLVSGTAIGVMVVAYAVGAVGLGVTAPTLPLVSGLGVAVGLLGYGIARYSAVAEGRVLTYDFAFSGLLTLAVSAFYFWIVLSLGLPFIVGVFVVILIIITHQGFDFVERSLDRLFFRKPMLALRGVLRHAAAEAGEHEAVKEGLRRTLATVVTSVDARWGAIVLREGEAFAVQASYHSLLVGVRLPVEGLAVRELTTLPPGSAAAPLPELTVVAPLIAGHDPIGAILLGPPKRGLSYRERDLDLVAEAADGLADLIDKVWKQETHASEIAQMVEAFRVRELSLQAEIESLRAPPEAETDSAGQVTQVEDALRQLHDYSYLGDHTLGSFVAGHLPSATHLDRGKALCTALTAAIEKLRPAGTEPRDLAPREWHPYLVLHEAYINGAANRDIMARLYISEATFHRTRRRALKAVTKALFEMDHRAGLVN